MAASREPTPEHDVEPFKAHHTAVQRAMLVINVLVVVACFIGAGALVAGKRVRESFVAAPRVTFDDDGDDTGATASGTTMPRDPTATTAPGQTPPATLPGTTAPTETFPAADPKAENFLITGDDNNGCIAADSPYAGAVAGRESGGNRSDTIMVIRLDPTTKAAAVLSFPRDLYVDIPGKAPARINTTFQEGRYDLMAQTLDENFGVRVDHFVQIDFCAFKTIVDAVGGVPVPLTNPIRDKNTGINILDVAQCHEFGGDEALAYVRSRHLEYQDADGTWKDDLTSDYGRISRQQDFLRRMLQTASKKGLYTPSVVSGLIDAVRNYVVFDAGFTIDDMLSFAGLLREIQPESLKTYQIQATGVVRSGNAVLLPQIDGANMTAILDIFRGKTALAAAPDQVADTTTSAPASTAPTTTTTSTTTTVVGAGPVTTASPDASTTSTTSSTTSTSTTSTTVAPPATNPEDITHGIVPDKNATC